MARGVGSPRCSKSASAHFCPLSHFSDLYNTCPDPASPAPPLRAPVGNTSLLARRTAKVPASAVTARAGDPYNCFGSGPTIEAWFNQPEVKAAMHVAPGIEFALCSGNFTFKCVGGGEEGRRWWWMRSGVPVV